MKNIFFISVLLGTLQVLFSQTNTEVIDSLMLEIDKSKNNEEKADLMAKLSFNHQYNNPKEGLRIAEEAEKLNPSIDSVLLNLYNSYAINHYRISNYTKAIDYLHKALNLSQDLEKTATLNGNLGVIYMELKDFSTSKKHLEMAISLDSELKNQSGLNRDKINLANLYNHLGQYDEAIKLYWEVYEYFYSINNTNAVALILNNLSHCLNKTKQYEKAIKYLLEAKSINITTGNLNDLQRNYYNLGMSNIQLLKEQIANKPITSIKNQPYYLKARIYLDSAIMISDQLYDLVLKNDALSDLSELHGLAGDFQEAFLNSKLSSEIKDSIFNQEKNIEIARIESQKEIEVLNFSKKAALEKAEKEKVQKTAMGGVLGLILIASFFLYRLYTKTRKAKTIAESERKRSEGLLLNILPAEIAEELKNQGSSPARKYGEVSILFTDFVNFTTKTESMTPEELVKELDVCFSAFDQIIEKYGLEKIKTIGDAYLAASGLPVEYPDHAFRCGKAAIEIRDFILERKNSGGPFDVRIGIHSGPVIAGIVGLKKYAYDIWGDTVNFAARMEQNSLPGQITISEHTFQLISQEADVSPRGEIELKNKGKHQVFFLNKL
jgi:adenylate cyclase